MSILIQNKLLIKLSSTFPSIESSFTQYQSSEEDDHLECLSKEHELLISKQANRQVYLLTMKKGLFTCP